MNYRPIRGTGKFPMRRIEMKEDSNTNRSVHIVDMSPRQRRLADPFKHEEEEKYGDPAIPSRFWVLEFLAHYPMGLRLTTLMQAFDLPPKLRKALSSRLKAMTKVGQLVKSGNASVHPLHADPEDLSPEVAVLVEKALDDLGGNLPDASFRQSPEGIEKDSGKAGGEDSQLEILSTLDRALVDMPGTESRKGFNLDEMGDDFEKVVPGWSQQKRKDAKNWDYELLVSLMILHLKENPQGLTQSEIYDLVKQNFSPSYQAKIHNHLVQSLDFIRDSETGLYHLREEYFGRLSPRLADMAESVEIDEALEDDDEFTDNPFANERPPRRGDGRDRFGDARRGGSRGGRDSNRRGGRDGDGDGEGGNRGISYPKTVPALDIEGKGHGNAKNSFADEYETPDATGIPSNFAETPEDARNVFLSGGEKEQDAFVLDIVGRLGLVSLRAISAFLGLQHKMVAMAERYLDVIFPKDSPDREIYMALKISINRLLAANLIVECFNHDKFNKFNTVYGKVREVSMSINYVKHVRGIYPDSYGIEYHSLKDPQPNGYERMVIHRRDGGPFPFYQDLFYLKKMIVNSRIQAQKVGNVIMKGIQDITGYLKRDLGGAFKLVSYNSKLSDFNFYLEDNGDPALDDDVVVICRIAPLETQEDFEELKVELVEILGDKNVIDLDEIKLAVKMYNLPYKFSDECLKLAQSMQTEINPRKYPGYRDLTGFNFITIDGQDARDFDDAVLCERVENGRYKLQVAIADVSHYVQDGDAIDIDAKARGTSVYFPRRVIPMLPESLSNNMCSLMPNVNRLAVVCEMIIGPKGEVESHSFSTAVIRSKNRMTYDEVHELIETYIKPPKKHLTNKKGEPVHERIFDIEALYELYLILREARTRRMALDFDSAETMMVFDENDKLKAMVPVIRNEAHMLIEECMLAANISAANFVTSNNLQALFRTHPAPSESRIKELKEKLAFLKVPFKGGQEADHQFYKDIVDAAADLPNKASVQLSILQSLPRAVYTPKNLGHFGLAYDEYAHFTSPIRRYPDLLLHRVIKAHLKGKVYRPPENWDYLGIISSYSERQADNASRYVESYIKAEFMRKHLGETFTGTITSMTSFGIFVTLDEWYIEGLIHVKEFGADLGDYFEFSSNLMSAIGQKTGIVINMGDKMEIVVNEVKDVFINFRLSKNEVKERRLEAGLDPKVPHDNKGSRRGGRGSGGFSSGGGSQGRDSGFSGSRGDKGGRNGQGKGGKKGDDWLVDELNDDLDLPEVDKGKPAKRRNISRSGERKRYGPKRKK